MFRIRNGEKVLYEKKTPFVRPPEMQRLKIDFSAFDLRDTDSLEAEIEVVPS